MEITNQPSDRIQTWTQGVPILVGVFRHNSSWPGGSEEVDGGRERDGVLALGGTSRGVFCAVAHGPEHHAAGAAAEGDHRGLVPLEAGPDACIGLRHLL